MSCGLRLPSLFSFFLKKKPSTQFDDQEKPLPSRKVKPILGVYDIHLTCGCVCHWDAAERQKLPISFRSGEGKVFETVGRTAMRPPSAAGDCPLHPHDDLVKDDIYAMCMPPREGSKSSAGVEVKTGRQAFEILRKTARRQETE
ncbi:hypothetical protein SMMN14_07574 [Sphaerulina musiva]